MFSHGFAILLTQASCFWKAETFSLGKLNWSNPFSRITYFLGMFFPWILMFKFFFFFAMKHTLLDGQSNWLAGEVWMALSLWQRLDKLCNHHSWDLRFFLDPNCQELENEMSVAIHVTLGARKRMKIIAVIVFTVKICCFVSKPP